MNKKKIFVLFIIFSLLITIFIIVFLSNKQEIIGAAGINRTEFDKIQLGMSQSTVNRTIDPDDLWYDEEIYTKVVKKISSSKDKQIYTYTYKYLGETSGYAIITYTADYSNGDLFVLPTVSKKEDFNLK